MAPTAIWQVMRCKPRLAEQAYTPWHVKGQGLGARQPFVLCEFCSEGRMPASAAHRSGAHAMPGHPVIFWSEAFVCLSFCKAPMRAEELALCNLLLKLVPEEVDWQASCWA